jgi:signal transduction histidine kinase/DNA-binding response OmpR family regulator
MNLPNLSAWINEHADPLCSAGFVAATAFLGFSCLLAAAGMVVYVGIANRRAKQVWSVSSVLLALGVVCAVVATALAMALSSNISRPEPDVVEAVAFLVLGVIQVGASMVYSRRADGNQGSRIVALGLLLFGALDCALPVVPAGFAVFSIFFMTTAALSLTMVIGLIVEELSYQSERKYRTVFEGSNEAMVIVGLWRYAILDANKAAQRLFKLPTKLLLGKNFLEMCPQLKECNFTYSAPYKFFTAVFRPHNEFPMLRADGSTVRCHGDANMVEWRGKMAVQLRIWERDRNASLNQIARRTEKMEALGKLIAGVAHELNNPLTVVLGLGQILNKRLSGKDREDLNKILHESERASTIVRELLGFARPTDPQFETVDLNELLSTVLDLRETGFQQHGIEVARRLASGLPLTKADPRQVEQVLINLVSNAIQAMSGQSTTRKLTVTTQENSQFIRITVSDTGPGIPAENLYKVFDPFFTTKPHGKGTGLGLSISSSIIEAHEGRLWVDPKPGPGATFHVEIPIVPCDPVKKMTTAQAPSTVASSAPATKARLLVVDDEPGICEVLRLTLEELGHTVDLAGNGLEALRKIETQQYDLILSDLNMPELDGEALYAKIVERDRRLARRIVFVTGDILNEKARNFLSGLPNHRIQKPFAVSSIETLIGNILSQLPPAGETSSRPSLIKPSAPAQPSAPVQSPPPPVPAPPAPVTSPAQRRVLVVDDEPGIREVLELTLASEGYAVDTATNGAEALQRIGSAQYNVIFSDLYMPEVDGQQLYETVRNTRPALAERFIFATGDAVSPKYRDFLQTVSNPWLSKPFSVAKLLGMMDDLNKRSALADSSAPHA